MNETECENLIKSVKWTEPSNLISLAILEFINVLVIGGNLLVIAAVFCSNKLRSVTNFFIVNLAVADLLVGLAVLPFSATWEVFKVWIFGDVWCRIWLAVDVWMCTASILNLCAISLDRYVAVTRPVTYPSIMSKKRAKSLIAGIWVLSFVICFPPLVGWKDQKTTVQPLTYTEGNHTLFYATRATIKTTTIFSTTLTPWTDTNGKKLHEKKKDNNYGFSANAAAKASNRLRIRTPVTTSANTNDHNTYNPNYIHQQQIVSNTVNDAVATDDGEEHKKTKQFIVYYDTSVPPAAAASTAQYSEENVFETLPDNSDDNENRILVKTTTTCPWICELTNDRGYVLYSALGSFYIPMFVMLFFYWRIYRAAVRTTRAINQGFKTTKGAKGIGTRFDEERLTLRIHRGRGSSMAQDSVHSNGSTNSVSTTLGTPSPERFSKYANRRYHQSHDKIKISVSYPSSENISEITQEAQSTLSSCSNNMLLAMHYNLPGERGTTENQLYRGSVSNNYQLQVGKTIPDIMRRPSDLEEQHSPQYQQQQQQQLSAASRANKKMGKRNIKAQVKRFRMETKAAKTLAIIVGLFIICWLPFFTMYIIRPFCEDCIDPLLFSILFWLGYCNSAVNPMIYALFSKDFRFAFKSIICRCFCSKQMKRETLKTSRRDSDMSTIRIRVRTPSITPSAAMHSFGEDSELQQSEIGHETR